ncbi:hypothetical protein BCU79_01025 [Vibrio breoganii]|nr:hypothetical protein BCU79_01025 [Vibrio breoganii]PMK41094.1 hypothetical protein BCU00_01880 [Vibrio breoganii]
MKKLVLYVFFALVATLVNLLAQEATSIVTSHELEIFVCMSVGTVAGLLVKYVLDKKFIFKYSTESHQKDFKTFILYSLMGVVTTLVFWVTEYTFDVWFDTKKMRYVGAVVGLSIGYIVKYHLDKKFVFVGR